MNAYKFGDNIYLPIFKCASSFYADIFCNKLKWETISVKDINWDKHYVFSHLINPATRHLKGLVEALIQYNLQDLVDDERFNILLGHCVFDIHSYPIVNTFGESNCRKIDWVLLDSPVSANVLTNKLLKNIGVDIELNSFPKINQSSNLEKILFEKIEKIRKNCTSIYGFYLRDFYLYKDVVSNFNYTSDSWNQITWLKNGSNL